MNISNLALEFEQLKPKSGDAYLKLQLNGKILSVLLLEHIQEVLVIPVEQITFIPSMGEYVLGLMNRHGKVLWVVDVAQMLGLESLEPNTQQYHIAIVKLENMLLGLAVKQVQGVMRLEMDQIESLPNNWSPNLIPYLRGWVQKKEGNLLVLEAKSIILEIFKIGDKT